MSPTHSHRRRSPRLWLAVIAAVLLPLIGVPAGFALADGGGDGGNQAVFQQLTANPDCTLKVPADPLTAQGLATPYELGSAGQQCSEANQNLAAFVQAVILDPATGALTVYDPVVKDVGTQLQGTAPPVPTLPPNAVVAIWTGFNGNVLKLVGPGHGSFVNFAQQSYANSPNMFHVLSHEIRDGLVKVPPLGTANDGKSCPSSRDFSIVDQDQSDNVPVSYPAYGVSNGSDEQLLNSVDAALGCTTWQLPLVSSTTAGATSPSGLLQEVQAAVYQQAPVALVPGLDDFVTAGAQGPTNGGTANLFLQNLYRLQVGQEPTDNGNDTAAYCANLAAAGEPRLHLDAPSEAGFPAPFFAPIGKNLALVLANRFAQTWQLLTCQQLTGSPSPIQVTTDANGVATSATYSDPAPGATPPANPTPTPTPTLTPGSNVTVNACVSHGGSIRNATTKMVTCPAGDTPVSWQATVG